MKCLLRNFPLIGLEAITANERIIDSFLVRSVLLTRRFARDGARATFRVQIATDVATLMDGDRSCRRNIPAPLG